MASLETNIFSQPNDKRQFFLKAMMWLLYYELANPINDVQLKVLINTAYKAPFYYFKNICEMIAS